MPGWFSAGRIMLRVATTLILMLLATAGCNKQPERNRYWLDSAWEDRIAWFSYDDQSVLLATNQYFELHVLGRSEPIDLGSLNDHVGAAWLHHDADDDSIFIASALESSATLLSHTGANRDFYSSVPEFSDDYGLVCDVEAGESIEVYKFLTRKQMSKLVYDANFNPEETCNFAELELNNQSFPLGEIISSEESLTVVVFEITPRGVQLHEYDLNSGQEVSTLDHYFEWHGPISMYNYEFEHTRENIDKAPYRTSFSMREVDIRQFAYAEPGFLIMPDGWSPTRLLVILRNTNPDGTISYAVDPEEFSLQYSARDTAKAMLTALKHARKLVDNEAGE